MHVLRITISLCLIVLLIRCSKDSASSTAEIPRITTVYSVDSASLVLLDRLYPSAITPDSATSAFSTEQEQAALGTAWSAYFRALRAHLDSGGVLKTDVGFFFTLYCDSSGRVDHLLYEVENDSGITANENFLRVVTSFVSSHDMGIKASRGFSQCGSIRFAASGRPLPTE